MAKINLGIGEMGVIREPGQQLQTLGLGSCVAVIILDPVLQQVGMVHIALPDSSINPVKATQTPGYFADTAIPRLLAEMKYQPPVRMPWIVKLVGGASVVDAKGVFNIGKRNILEIKRILWSNKLAVMAEDVGESFSRSVLTDVAEGRVYISAPGGKKWEI